jgi:hypothetical protein
MVYGAITKDMAHFRPQKHYCSQLWPAYRLSSQRQTDKQGDEGRPFGPVEVLPGPPQSGLLRVSDNTSDVAHLSIAS